jgi:hypothetical protein
MDFYKKGAIMGGRKASKTISIGKSMPQEISS